MALQSSIPTHATHSAASAIAHPRATPKHASSADDQGDGGFAAQLMRAQPDDGAKPADADAKTASADGKDARDGKAKDADSDGKDVDPKAAAKAPDGTPPPVDPTAQPAWPPQPAIATTALAAKPDADVADGPVDPFAALRKGKGAKDVGLAALGLGKDAGKDAKAADATGAATTGKGSKSAVDFAAQLGKSEGAGNGATGTKDAMAALLPQPDPVAVQAGAIGASPNAIVDNNLGAAGQQAPVPQAQAELPMPPQSPAFAPALGQQISVWMKDGIQHAEVQLSPMDLGPIRVRIEMAGAQTRVEMAADVQSTRDALQQALPQLADSLGQVGISLTGGGVSDQSTAQQQAQAQSTFADAHGGASGRSGGSRTRGQAGDVGGHDVAMAAAPRAAVQKRGLLDMYV